MTKSTSNSNSNDTTNNYIGNNTLNRRNVRNVAVVGVHGMRVMFPGVSSQPTMDILWNHRRHQILMVKP